MTENYKRIIKICKESDGPFGTRVEITEGLMRMIFYCYTISNVGNNSFDMFDVENRYMGKVQYNGDDEINDYIDSC